jgi:hypothetical protein
VALEGNLSDFSLPDMFRLLATGAKTGVLHAEDDDRAGVVCFRDGEVVFASAWADAAPVGKALVATGIITDKQLRQASGLMKIQKKAKADRRLGQILVDEGYLDEAVLEHALREQVADALFELLRWEQGQLRFESDEEFGDRDLGYSVPVDVALSDAEKRLETWRRIREKIPSGTTRFAMAPGPGSSATEIHLKPREWMLLCYLHDGRSVDELVSLTGYNDFETAKILYSMYAEGLILKVGPTGDALPD